MIEFWKLCIIRDLEIYKNLNCFHLDIADSQTLISYFWIPDCLIWNLFDIYTQENKIKENYVELSAEEDKKLRKDMGKTQYLQMMLQKMTSSINGAKLEIENYLPNRTTPNYFRENEMLFGFQEIVDTYGVPRYKELNPAVFTLVTFPFLFGVMYGDIGHG